MKCVNFDYQFWQNILVHHKTLLNRLTRQFMVSTWFLIDRNIFGDFSSDNFQFPPRFASRMLRTVLWICDLKDDELTCVRKVFRINSRMAMDVTLLRGYESVTHRTVTRNFCLWFRVRGDWMTLNDSPARCCSRAELQFSIFFNLTRLHAT